jgi:lipopolysaccharide transport protein LptA
MKITNAKKIIMLMSLTSFIWTMDCGLGTISAQEMPIIPKSEEVRGFVMTIVDKGGKEKASISGSKANILQGGLIEILDVVARIYGQEKGDSDTLVHTQKGLYNKFQNIISTDQFVRINRRGMIVTGTGIKWLPEKEKLKIDENVRIDYSPEENKNGASNADITSRLTVITSRGCGVLDYSKGMAVLERDVVVENADTNLKAHTMKVYFDKISQQIQRVDAYGDVKIKQPKRESKSKKAVYYVGEDKIELTGKPRIVQGLDFYTAEKVTIYDKGNRVVFEPKAELIIYIDEEKEIGGQ